MGLNEDLVQEEKKQLRRLVKQMKAAVSLEEKRRKSHRIWEALEKLSIFVEASVIVAYWSMDDEVFTHDFVHRWHKTKKILLPSVDGDDLRLKHFCGIESMRAGESFGILEPTGDDYTAIDQIDMIIVPGVAFDYQGNRMGRGRGFYDRLLSHTSAHKIGVCFDFQYFPSVPSGPLDVPMDMVIVEP